MIRHFRAHQQENTERLQALLAEHETPYCDAFPSLLPWPGECHYSVQAVVVLKHTNGLKFVYRETNMHYFLMCGDISWHTFEKCSAHLLKDACGDMGYTSLYQEELYSKKREPPKNHTKRGLTR